MKIKYIKTASLALFFSASTALFSQNIGINYSGTAPDVNAILDLNTGNNNNLGLIIPNVQLTNSATTFSPPMSNPATPHDVGLMVYNSIPTLEGTGFYYWNGTNWVSLASGLAKNGLTANGDITQLGGPLIQNTSITASSSNYMMDFDLGTGTSPGTGTFSITNGGASNTYLSVVNSGLPGAPGQVGIGTGAPNLSAVVDVTSGTGGVLYPRLTSAQISAINPVPNGLVVFNITTQCLEVYAGESWTNISCCNPPSPTSVSGTVQYCAGSSGDIYTVSPVAGATGYIWSMQPSVSGSSITGNGTQATANFASTPQTYTISVKDTNYPFCISAATNYIVNMGAPPVAPPVPTGLTNPTINTSGTYTITTTPGDSYTWSSSNTNIGTIANQSVGSATVNFGATAGTTSICVYSSVNGCNSTPSCLSVTSSSCNTVHGTINFSYTGSSQSWVVPCNVSVITVTLYGAQGGLSYTCESDGWYATDPATGGTVVGTLNVVTNTVINIWVGGGGAVGSISAAAAGGFNGGGAGAYYSGNYGGGGGGGESDIRVGGNAIANWIAVAGGGGGEAYNYGCGTESGGEGGASTGQCGFEDYTSECGNPNPPGGGGSQVAGGAGGYLSGYCTAASGAQQLGGAGGTCSNDGGGGGGGYYGGGGGVWGGGGGGSNYTGGLTTVITNSQGGGPNNGNTHTSGANGTISIQY